MKMNKIFTYTKDFQKSNKYREWHKSYTAIIKHALEPKKEFIRN